MRPAGFATGAVILLFACAYGSSAQQNDSLAYISYRARVTSIDSTHPALQTADALAEAGLFADAAGILQDHALADAGPTETTPAPRKSAAQWRISSGTDYYHLEDVDTAAMTAEELRDYKRLTETPLSVWLRARSAITPTPAFIEEIVPEVYVSERKGRLAAGARLSSFGDLVTWEPSVKVEKWFRADASFDSAFAPARGQPSDMRGAGLVVTAANTDKQPGALVWSIPVSADWEHYRRDRPGYEAFIEYGLSPSLDIRPDSSRLGACISAHAGYENYYRPGADSLDVLRFSGRVEGFGRTEKLNGQVNASWTGDRYVNAVRIEAVDRIEGSGRIEYRPTGSLCGRLRVRGIYERENHGAVPEYPAFEIHGSELLLEPGIETAIGAHLRITPAVLWERRWTAGKGEYFIWEPRRSWEPGLRIGWSSTVLEAAVRGAYRYENIDGGFEAYTADSRSLHAGAEAGVNAGRLLSITLFADYQFRAYAPWGGHGRVSENLTISLAVTRRFLRQ